MVIPADFPDELQGSGIQFVDGSRLPLLSQNFDVSAQGVLPGLRDSIVLQLRVPVVSTPGREVKDIPDRRQQINTAVHAISHSCGPGIEMFDGSVRRSNKDADAGVLAAVSNLKPQISFEV